MYCGKNGRMEGWKIGRISNRFLSIIVNLMLISLVLIGLNIPTDNAMASGPTNVSGLISEDIIWTSANSPYHIIDNTTLMTGKTLTIQAGTVVKFSNNTWLKISGTLIVKGTVSNRVVFTNLDPKFNYTYGNYYNGSGINYYIWLCGSANISYAKFEYSSDKALYAGNVADIISDSIFINNKIGINKGYATIKRCKFENSYYGISANNEIVYDSLFQDNYRGLIGTAKCYNCTFQNNIYGLTASHRTSCFNSTFKNNTYGLTSNAEGLICINNSFIENEYGISAQEEGKIKFCKIRKNVIGLWIGTDELLYIIKNSIYENTIGLKYGTSYFNSISYNNIYNNSQYNLNYTSLMTLNASNNWWGTTNTTTIDQFIYDIYDDVSLGEVNYNPYLNFSVDTTFKLPKADAGPDQYALIGETVFFNGSGSYDPEDNSLKYKWDFGDGESTGWQNSYLASHKYTSKGDYVVFLSVSYDDLFFDTDTCIIQVREPGPQLANSPWPKFRGDLRNTGLSKYDTSQNQGDLLWTFSPGISISSSPAIDSFGTIYVGSNDYRLYAINPNGTQKWNFMTGYNVKSSPAIGSDGTIYVGSNDYKLYAINSDGTQKWNFTTGDWVESSPTLGSDGTIYVGSNDDKLYAINSDGTQKWSFNSNNDVRSSPVIASDGTIYVGSDDSKLYAINPNGTKKWSFNTNSAIRSSPAIGSDDTIYVGVIGGNFYAINPNGTKKWSYMTGAWVESSPAIGSDGTIYVGSNDKKLHAIYPNGTQKWSFNSYNVIRSSPSIGSDGTIYVGSNDKKFYAINPNGTKKWIYNSPVSIGRPSPAIGSDGTIYVLLSGKLYALGINDTEPPNHPPIANAGPDQNVSVNQTVYFDGGGSYDPDGDSLTYKWNFGDGTSTDWQNHSNTSHSYNKIGVYTVTLAVRDVSHSPLLTDNDICIIQVFDFKENQPPVADAGPDQNITVGELLNFNGSRSYDPDGIIISYEWTSSIDDKLGTGKIIQNSKLSEGIHTITLEVSDGELTDTDTCIVRVANISGNLPPLAKITPLKIVMVGETVRLSGGDSYDEDGFITQFHWDFGDDSESGWINVSTTEHKWDPAGIYTITLIVMDNDGATGSIFHDIIVTKLDGDGNGDGNDTDNDGLPNAWELEFGLDPFDPSDANLDTDGDSLTNQEEYILGTDPTKFDTDGDGVTDKIDAFPTDAAASVDSDGDKYPDSWNPGMSENDSTTGLKLDPYPNDPNRYKKETSQDNTFAIILIIIVIIILLLIATSKLLLSRSKRQREKKLDPNEEILGNMKHKFLQDEPLSELAYSRNDISDMLERKFKNGQLSEHTYHLIRSEVLFSEETQLDQVNNVRSEGKE